MKIEWVDRFVIKTAVDHDRIMISANREDKSEEERAKSCILGFLM